MNDDTVDAEVRHAAAIRHVEQGDHGAAIAIWASISAEQRNDAGAYVLPSRSLRQLRRYEEAERLMAEAYRRFPNDPEVAVEFAWCAQDHENWDSARQRWDIVRIALPSRLEGWIAAAEDAQREARWREAARHWGVVAEKFAEFWQASLHQGINLKRADAPDEADAVFRSALERFPSEPQLFWEYALAAEGRGNHAETAERWRLMVEAFPENDQAYVFHSIALSNGMRYGEAEQTLMSGIARMPDDRSFPMAMEFCWVSIRSRDATESVRRFREFSARFPSRPEGYLGASVAFTMIEDFDGCEAFLTQGLHHCPDNKELHQERIKITNRLVDSDPAAITRILGYLTDYRERFPDDAAACALEIGFRNRIGHHSEVERCAREGLLRWPDDPALLIAHADAAAALGDTAGMLDRFNRVVTVLPERPEGHIGLARAHAQTGRHAMAETVLREAISAIPTASTLYAEYAALATQQHAWQEAVSRWADALRLFPNEAPFAARLQEAQLAALGPSETGPEIANSTNLLDTFESFGGGDSQGCEFGTFQRFANSEPLSLLRWANVKPTSLIRALRAEFAGLGDPAQTSIEIGSAEIGEEYVTTDTSYDIQMHSFLRTSEIDMEKAGIVLRRRQKALATKLVADLRAGSKIFVYRLISRDLDDGELAELHTAIRAYGDGWLLYVRYETPEKLNGTVEVMRPGLMIGYIDRFAFGRDGTSLGPAFVSWMRICQNAHTLWSAARITP